LSFTKIIPQKQQRTSDAYVQERREWVNAESPFTTRKVFATG